ncbi:MAG: mechanosensitive ion channel family protein [Gammaproteobacteria bacterium]
MNDIGSFWLALTQLSEHNLIRIGMIVAGGWLLLASSQSLLPWIAKRTSGRLRIFLLGLTPLLRLLIIVTVFTLVVPLLIEPTFKNLVALLGALGVVLGFALKDYVSSLIAGIVTLYEMPYRPGDWIEINGAYGEVRAVNMRTLEIVTPDDTVVVIPHLKLWNELIFNANDGGQNLLCIADFYLDPRHDAAKVRHALHNVAVTSVYIRIEKPVEAVVSERPWGTRYRLKAYPVDPRLQFRFATDLTVRGKAALIGLGAEFAAPPPVPLAAHPSMEDRER